MRPALDVSRFEGHGAAELPAFRDEWLALLTQVFERIEPAALAAGMEAASRHVIVRDEAGVLIAGCFCHRLEMPGHPVCGIAGVAVHPSRRGAGLGRQVIEAASAPRSGVDGYLAWTRKTGLFAACGFRDFSGGIETQPGDSTPMLKPSHPDLVGRDPVPLWPRIKF